MARVEQWLEQVGLAPLTDILIKNDIDLDILPELTDADLEKLGLSLGQRRRLLKAAATLSAVSPVPVEPAIGAKSAQLEASSEAERRQVTVLFSDLVGSTALANSIDPEEMSGLIRRYQDACAGAIARFDGYLAKFMGDGVLAYFGYPQAHEDSAERAVRAGLAIIDAVRAIERPDRAALQTRVGIATGLVVVGEIIGSGAAREKAIVGETPNLAARLQALAEPDCALVSQATHRLIGRRFESRSLGDQTLKGFAEPVPAWQVLREADATSRFAAAQSASLGPFVGRTQEIGLLLERWQLARQGEGQAIVLTGEPGMGKSRLVEALFERIGDEPHQRIVTQCSPYYSNTAFFPITRQFEQAAGFSTTDTPAEKLDKLDRLFERAGRPATQAAALMADLLSLPASERFAPIELSPAQRKATTLTALVDHLLYLSDGAPVLFVLEDAHWVDPSTMELLTRLLDSIEKAPVLAIITGRPEFTAPWTGRDHVASLALSRLGRRQCAEMVAGIAAKSMMSADLLEEILARTDGVPLFVEELTRTVTETNATSQSSTVPATLQDSLMARLDRLGPAREIAQIAAVIGRQFPYTLLAAMTGLNDTELQNALARLSEAGLVFPQSRATEPTYMFKHALTRDVAYDSLLRTRRQQLHERLARTVQRRFPELVEAEPEVLAYHMAQAGLASEAAELSERAGDRAVARWAYAEAAAHYEQTLAQLACMPGDSDRDRRQLTVLLKKAPVILVYKGLRDPEARRVAHDAYDLAKAVGDRRARFKALWGLWFGANLGRERVVLNYADELVQLGRDLDDEALFLEAIHCRWSTSFFRGDVRGCLTDGAEGVRLYDAERHKRLAAEFGGHDAGVCALGVGGLGYAQAGRPRKAADSIQRSIELADSLNQPASRTHALMNAMMAHQVIGDHEAVLRLAQQMIEIAERLKLAPPRSVAVFMSGWATASGDELARGHEQMEAEFQRVSSLGPLPQYYAALLADVRLRAGKTNLARELLDASLPTIKEPGVGFYVPELHRLRGECLLRCAPGDRDEALDELERALNFASSQHARVLELRAAISLANAASAGARAKALDRLEELVTILADDPPIEVVTARQVLAAVIDAKI
jgi:class 3 adenylate cyclase/tetratricopeptide (TPR) repeat protein